MNIKKEQIKAQINQNNVDDIIIYDFIIKEKKEKVIQYETESDAKTMTKNLHDINLLPEYIKINEIDKQIVMNEAFDKLNDQNQIDGLLIEIDKFTVAVEHLTRIIHKKIEQLEACPFMSVSEINRNKIQQEWFDLYIAKSDQYFKKLLTTNMIDLYHQLRYIQKTSREKEEGDEIQMVLKYRPSKDRTHMRFMINDLRMNDMEYLDLNYNEQMIPWETLINPISSSKSLPIKSLPILTSNELNDHGDNQALHQTYKVDPKYVITVTKNESQYVVSIDENKHDSKMSFNQTWYVSRPEIITTNISQSIQTIQFKPDLFYRFGPYHNILCNTDYNTLLDSSNKTQIILLYGPTGSGKTSTLFGYTNTNNNFIPGIFQSVYESAKAKKAKHIPTKFDVWEYSNDNFKRIGIWEVDGQDNQDTVIISEIDKQRKKSATLWNTNSSRSHIIIYVQQPKTQHRGDYYNTHILIDLAGNELPLDCKQYELDPERLYHKYEHIPSSSWSSWFPKRHYLPIYTIKCVKQVNPLARIIFRSSPFIPNFSDELKLECYGVSEPQYTVLCLYNELDVIPKMSKDDKKSEDYIKTIIMEELTSHRDWIKSDIKMITKMNPQMNPFYSNSKSSIYLYIVPIVDKNNFSVDNNIQFSDILRSVQEKIASIYQNTKTSKGKPRYILPNNITKSNLPSGYQGLMSFDEQTNYHHDKVWKAQCEKQKTEGEFINRSLAILRKDLHTFMRTKQIKTPVMPKQCSLLSYPIPDKDEQKVDKDDEKNENWFQRWILNPSNEIGGVSNFDHVKITVVNVVNFEVNAQNDQLRIPFIDITPLYWIRNKLSNPHIRFTQSYDVSLITQYWEYIKKHFIDQHPYYKYIQEKLSKRVCEKLKDVVTVMDAQNKTSDTLVTSVNNLIDIYQEDINSSTPIGSMQFVQELCTQQTVCGIRNQNDTGDDSSFLWNTMETDCKKAIQGTKQDIVSLLEMRGVKQLSTRLEHYQPSGPSATLDSVRFSMSKPFVQKYMKTTVEPVAAPKSTWRIVGEKLLSAVPSIPSMFGRR